MVAACARGSGAPSRSESATGAAAAARSPESNFPLRVSGARFIDAAGGPFEWRGITAFRLAEQIASGREPEAVAFLDWAASRNLTVVRVFLMASRLFALSPEDGRRALPRLLDLAKARGLAVEAVALVDTASRTVDYETHVQEIGRIAAAKANAVIELANEPAHPTQDRRLHDPAFLKRLGALVPSSVLVALGSIEDDKAYGAGEYATFHAPRSDGWGHVLGLRAGARLVAELGKPVVSDEPIGAAAAYQEGSRDNLPSRFAAAAALTRLTGMGATFHYEGGLQARIPGGREAACFDAWRQGLDLIDRLPATSDFLEGAALERIARATGSRAAFARASSDEATLVLVDPAATMSVKWVAGWRETRRASLPGVLVTTAARVRNAP